MGTGTRTTSRLRSVSLLCAVLLLATGCADAGGAAPGAVTVVATTTILGDVVRSVVGGNGTVEVLLPRGADPHDYRLSARQAASLREADLVVANGLGLEEGLSDALESAVADGVNLFEVAARLDPIPFGDGAGLDPHVWLDPLRMADAARLIAVELAGVEPGIDWAGRAEAYAAELVATDGQVVATLAAVPEERRKLVTNHDSFGYFADRYGFEIVGTVIPGGATLSDPSSAALASLIDLIDQEGVPAVFAETTEPAALAAAVAAEAAGEVAVVDLYTGSLGEPGSGADSLTGMLLANAERIAAALS